MIYKAAVDVVGSLLTLSLNIITMRYQATIFMICFILHCVSSHKRPCTEQVDCPGRGMRCVFKAAKDLSVACEIMPESMSSKCRCRRGCLTCDGGPNIGTSRFIKQGQSVRVGCGINLCACDDARENSIVCTGAACPDPSWLEHCRREEP